MSRHAPPPPRPAHVCGISSSATRRPRARCHAPVGAAAAGGRGGGGGPRADGIGKAGAGGAMGGRASVIPDATLPPPALTARRHRQGSRRRHSQGAHRACRRRRPAEGARHPRRRRRLQYCTALRVRGRAAPPAVAAAVAPVAVSAATGPPDPRLTRPPPPPPALQDRQHASRAGGGSGSLSLPSWPRRTPPLLTSLHLRVDGCDGRRGARCCSSRTDTKNEAGGTGGPHAPAAPRL